MCRRGCNVYFSYYDCGHVVPDEACKQYAPKLKLCLSDPVTPIHMDITKMKYGGEVIDNCDFCIWGMDLEGIHGFGEMWQDAAQYRKPR